MEMNPVKLSAGLVEAFRKAVEPLAVEMLVNVELSGKETFPCKITLEKAEDGKYSGRLKLTVKKVTETTRETAINLDGEQQELDFGNE